MRPAIQCDIGGPYDFANESRARRRSVTSSLANKISGNLPIAQYFMAHRIVRPLLRGIDCLAPLQFPDFSMEYRDLDHCVDRIFS